MTGECQDGRPIFKMIEADGEDVGDRFIYYAGKSQERPGPRGWKFATDLTGRSWDMLSPVGPVGSDPNCPDIPEGKFTLDNDGTGVKMNAPMVSRTVSVRDQES